MPFPGGLSFKEKPERAESEAQTPHLMGQCCPVPGEGVPSPAAISLYMSVVIPAPKPGAQEQGPPHPLPRAPKEERFGASSLGAFTCW